MKICTCVALALCLALPLALTGCEEEKQAANAIRPVRAVEARVASMGLAELLTGEVEAHNTVSASFRIAGQVAERLVAAGDVVTKGQVLARLDDTVARDSLVEAKASETAAEAALDQAARKAARARSLIGQRAISKNDYDLAVRTETEARAQLDAARAQRNSAEENLSYTELRAEADGFISSRHAESGEVVAAGQAIFKIAERSGLDAVFDVPERLMLAGLARGREIEICLDSDSSSCAKGAVYELSPQADATTRTWLMRAAMPEPSPKMLLGSAVRGRVVLDDTPVMALPAQALWSQGGSDCVWVLERAGESTYAARLRPVTVARFTSESVIISEGLSEGELVATAGVQTLVEGQVVRLVASAAAEGGAR